MAIRLVLYLFAVPVGLWWYLAASTRPITFVPTDLGLVHLPHVVLALFLGICVAQGFTFLRVVLLVVPAVLFRILVTKLILLPLALRPSSDFYVLRWQMYGTVFYLSLVLGWIALFPLPFAWPRVLSESVAFWRRTQWTVLGILAVGLVTFVWYTTSLVQSGEPSLAESAETVEFAGRWIQSLVLAIYLFALFKVALRFELAERYGPQIEGAESSEA